MARTLTYPVISARFERALDGDTFVMRLAWLRSWEKRASIEHVRLNGWRALELKDPSDGVRKSGAQAREMAEIILTGAAWLEVTVRGVDEYGRVLGEIMTPGGDLGRLLEAEGCVIGGNTRGIPVEPIPD